MLNNLAEVTDGAFESRWLKLQHFEYIFHQNFTTKMVARRTKRKKSLAQTQWLAKTRFKSH